MEKKELVNLDIRFLFMLFTSFIAMWIYFYNYIIDLTTMNPTDIFVFYLLLLHYTTFVFLILLAILLFHKGLSYTDVIDDFRGDSKIENIINICKNFVLKWWLFFFTGALLTIILSKFFTQKFWIVLILLVYYIAILLYIPIMGNNSNVKRLTKKMSISTLGILIFGIFPYLIVMTIVAADVKITTEKEFYKKGDIVRIETKRKGYIFLPNIEEITFNGFPIKEKNNSQETISFHIDDNNYCGSFDCVSIKYKPQIFHIHQDKYNILRITAE